MNDYPTPPPPQPASVQELPRLTLLGSTTDNDTITFSVRLSRVTDPRRIIAGFLANDLPGWKAGLPAWRRYESFAERLQEAEADLKAAEAAAVAARAAWQDAIRGGQPVTELEHNHAAAKVQAELVRERLEILTAKKRELQTEIETAWRARINDILKARRSLSEERVREARGVLGQTLHGLAITTIVEEMALSTYMQLGAVGVFGLSPRLF